MSEKPSKYCLDANIIIKAWQEYYSPRFCSSYWEILNELGIQEKIFLPQMVFEEITRTDDDLSDWLKQSKIPIHKIDGPVTECLKFMKLTLCTNTL